jgi:hypothetical protein
LELIFSTVNVFPAKYEEYTLTVTDAAEAEFIEMMSSDPDAVVDIVEVLTPRVPDPEGPAGPVGPCGAVKRTVQYAVFAGVYPAGTA